MIEKYLDIDKTRWAVDELERQGVTVRGFFMLGFPTETEEELRETIRFALDSKMSMASFFTVVPQPETPLYEQALQEGAKQLEIIRQNEMKGGSYHNETSWYALTYNFPLYPQIRKANWRFYSSPSRALKLLWRWPKISLWHNMSNIMQLMIPGWSALTKRKAYNSTVSLATPSSLGVSDEKLASREAEKSLFKKVG